MAPAIKVENLTHVYSPGTPFQTVSLDGVSLEIKRGEFFALVGSAGSGKTTLVMHFNGIIVPAAEKVWVCGTDVSDKKNRRELWRKVGLVFQRPEQQLFEETVFEDVAFGPRNMGLDRDEVRERVGEALRMVGLKPGEVEKLSPFRLSGGIRRRVAIAGVLALKPDVLVLDEPAAGLDPRGRRQLMDHVENFRYERGGTVVLVTHSMEEVAQRADRVAVLHEGHLAIEGAPREVFNRVVELRALGLDVPAPAGLMHKLRAAGKQVRADVLTIDEAREEISTILRKKL